MEFRVRTEGRRFRLVLGRATTVKEHNRLKKLRDVCKRLAERGEWDVLDAAKHGRVNVAEVARLIDQHGWADYRVQLDIEGSVVVPSLRDHADRWLDTLDHSGTLTIYKRDIARLCEFRVDGTPLGKGPWSAVHPHHIRDAHQAVKKILAHNTVRTCLAAWGSFFQWAIEREESEAAAEGRKPLMTASPVRRAGRWGQPKVTRHRFLYPREYRQLIDVAAPPMKAQYATLTWCALRIDEFMSLPPVHMSLPTHLTVAPWGTWKPKGYPRVTRAVRDVPIHRTELLPLLEEYRDEWAGDVAFFVNPNTGQPWTYTTFTDRMRPDVEAAGMVYGQRKNRRPMPNGVTPHTLRHTLPSWMAQRDVQLLKIANLIGDTIDTAARHYTHLLPSDIDETLNGLEV